MIAAHGGADAGYEIRARDGYDPVRLPLTGRRLSDWHWGRRRGLAEGPPALPVTQGAVVTIAWGNSL